MISNKMAKGFREEAFCSLNTLYPPESKINQLIKITVVYLTYQHSE